MSFLGWNIFAVLPCGVVFLWAFDNEKTGKILYLYKRNPTRILLFNTLFYAFFKACSMSSIKSSAFSMPTDNRIRSG